MRPSLVLTSLLALAVSAHAELTVHTMSAGTAARQMDVPLAVPRFDPALGHLDGVRIEAHLQATAGYGYENTSRLVDKVTVQIGAAAVVRAPGGAALLSLASTVQATEIIDAFDGQVDFAGASGRLALGIEVGAQQGQQLSSDPFWIAGILGNQGPIMLQIEIDDLSSISSSQQHVVRRGQMTEVEVTVIYMYTPEHVAD
jgi:hypothetical protein